MLSVWYTSYKSCNPLRRFQYLEITSIGQSIVMPGLWNRTSYGPFTWTLWSLCACQLIIFYESVSVMRCSFKNAIRHFHIWIILFFFNVISTQTVLRLLGRRSKACFGISEQIWMSYTLAMVSMLRQFQAGRCLLTRACIFTFQRLQNTNKYSLL